LWAPPQLEEDQELHVEINGVAYTQMISRGRRATVSLRLDAAKGTAFDLRIRARHAWQPALDGESGDQRLLAYKLVSAELEH
jgi:hypothetical protein